MKKPRTVIAVTLALAFLLGMMAVAGWFLTKPDPQVAIQRHTESMESAWQLYLSRPEDQSHLDTFKQHRDELVRMGHWEQRSFEVPVKPGTQASRDLIMALITQSDSRPVVEWTPSGTNILVTVTASAKQMPKWETLIGQWMPPAATAEQSR